MPRTRNGAGKGRQGQDVKAINKDVAVLRKQAREMLRKSGKNLREFRKEVSALKKAGVVSARVTASKQEPTRYMRSKVKRFADVLRGDVVAVRAPRDVRLKYKSKGVFEERGSFLIVPRESANQTTRISRGLIEVVHQLKMGEKTRVILPFHATDMEGVAHRLKEDPTLDGLKRPNELFGFRLFGHNMDTIGFPDADSLANYILERYGHLFSGKAGREGVKHFELFRFRSRRSQLPEPPREGRIYAPRGKKRPEKERDWFANKRREKDALRKFNARKRETRAQRQARLDYQRNYAAQKRQRDFEGD